MMSQTRTSWDEADASNDSQLAELYLDGSSVLAAGESVRLGNAFAWGDCQQPVAARTGVPSPPPRNAAAIR
jgi:hypothetical protein